MTRLRWQELALTAGAGILAVVMFLDWFDASAGVGDFSRQDGALEFAFDDGQRNAWQAFSALDLVLAATVVSAIACVAAAAARGERGELHRALVGIETALAILSVVMVAVRIATPPSLGLAPNVDITATVWAWVGLGACCALAVVGGLALFRTSERAQRTAPVRP